MTIPGPSPASMVAGSRASERISIGVSPAVTQIGPRCTSPDLSFVGLVLQPIGFAPDHAITTINYHAAAHIAANNYSFLISDPDADGGPARRRRGQWVQYRAAAAAGAARRVQRAEVIPILEQRGL